MTLSSVPPAPGASGRAGLTIIEIAVALAVMALLVAGLFASMNTSLKADSLTRERQAAAEEATRQLDLWLSTPNYGFSNSVATFDVMKKVGQANAVATTGEVALPPATANPTLATLVPNAPINADRPIGEQRRAGRVSSVVNAQGRGNNYVEITASVRWCASDGSNQQLDMVSAQVREE